MDALVPDPDQTIDDGAVLPWNAGAGGCSPVRRARARRPAGRAVADLTDEERDIVLHGEPVQRRVRFRSGRRNRTVELNVTYENAIAAAERSAATATASAARRQVQQLPRHPDLLGLPRHPAAARGADLAAGRAEPGRDQRAPPGRAARLRRRLPPQLPDELKRLTDGPAQRAGRRADAAAGRRPGLPGPGPVRRVAVHRGAAADRADLDRAGQHHRHAVRPGRAVGGPAPRATCEGLRTHHRRAGRQRQLGGRRRARAGDHPQPPTGSIELGPAAGSPRRQDRRPGAAGG